MNFTKHSDLKDQHAFLSGSRYHWINYSNEKLDSVFTKFLAIKRGTELHDFAKRCIELGIKLPRSKKTLNQYVNDAIGYRMIPEQILFYSYNAFGTADAISFRKKMLRIHDLKTGESRVSINQLQVYTALFCLEYEQKPSTIAIELRIYQSDEVFVYEPDPVDIRNIMDKIINFDKRIDQIREDEESWMT